MTKVAVTCSGDSLEAEVDPRFGRCPAILIVDTDQLTFDVVGNTGSEQSGGAGIETARLVAERGVRAVLTGSCGPNAHRTLTAAGIEIYTGCRGTVAEAVADFKADRLKRAQAPNVESHSGMGGRR